VCSITVFRKSCLFFEIMCKNEVQRGRPKMTIWRMRIACCIPKGKETHAHNIYYVLLFHCNNGCRKAPKSSVIRTLPVLFSMWKGRPSDNKLSERLNAPYLPSINCSIRMVRKYMLVLCKIISNVLLVLTKSDK